ncbi:MAG: YqjK-like family protein [Gallionella sp.]
MKQRFADIAYRRRGLLEKIKAQRMEVAEISRLWQAPVAVLDAGIKAVRFVRSHPGLIPGGFAAILSLRGMGIAGLAQKGWRLLLDPAAITFGLKYLLSVTRSPRQVRNSDAEH